MKVVKCSHVILAVAGFQVVVDVLDSASVLVAASSASNTSLTNIKLCTAELGDHFLLALNGGLWVVV